MGAYAGFDQGGLPPELAAAMGQSPQPEPPEQSPEEMMRQALDLIHQALATDGFTEQEKLTFQKVTTLLQTPLAAREKEDQALVGGGPATNALARAYGG